jgi:hypothetical protein
VLAGQTDSLGVDVVDRAGKLTDLFIGAERQRLDLRDAPPLLRRSISSGSSTCATCSAPSRRRPIERMSERPTARAKTRADPSPSLLTF